MEPEYKTSIYKQVFFNYTLRNCLSHIKPCKTDLAYDDLKSKSFTYPIDTNTLGEIAFIVYENLKKTLGKSRVKQIENSCKDNHYTCFLIIGEDNDLIDGIVSYLYYLYAPSYLYRDDESLRRKFVYKNLSGKDEDTIKAMFEPSYTGKTLRSMKSEELTEALLRPESGFFSHYFNGDMVFLRDMGNYPDALKRIVGIIRDYENHSIRINPGVLVISMGSDAGLPKELIEQFRPMYLETTVLFEEKTLMVTINGKKYTNLQDYEYRFCKLLYENKGVYVDYKRIKKEAFGRETDIQQIHNTKNSIKKKLNGCVNIESKRGVGYMMTV